MSTATILTATLPVYLMMLLGALSRRMGWLPKEADAGIINLVVWVLFPALAWDRIVGNSSLADPWQVLMAAAVGFGLVTLSITLCYWIAPLIGLKRGEGRRTFALACGLQNYGFVAIPVAEALFGRQIVGVLFTYSLGMELGIWTVGVGLLTGLEKAPWRLVINAPVIAIISGLLLHYSGFGGYLPAFLLTHDSSGIGHGLLPQLGACSVPICVLVIGASIHDLIGAERFKMRIAIAAPVLRLAVLPVGFILAGRYLPVSHELKQVLCVQASMPSAVFGILLSRMYGGHAPTATQVVVATTIVSLVTTPFVLVLAMKFMGV